MAEGSILVKYSIYIWLREWIFRDLSQKHVWCISLAVLEMYAKLKDQMKNRRLATSLRVYVLNLLICIFCGQWIVLIKIDFCEYMYFLLFAGTIQHWKLWSNLNTHIFHGSKGAPSLILILMLIVSQGNKNLQLFCGTVL